MSHLVNGSAISPRRGEDLRVLIIARISTVNQDARSLDDQAALCEGHVRGLYSGPIRFTTIQGRGSGETLDRKDLADAEAAVESGDYDLVVVEDLGRICRRTRAIDFCEACEDADTRLIAINDSIDTARDDWQLNAGFASLKHESGNKDTARRIRRSLRNRFVGGGVVQTLPYGYIKPAGADSDAEVAKDPAAGPVYEGWFRRLEAGASYAEVADWLNDSNVPTGVWTRSGRWTGTMVGRVTRNPILKGLRRRNERMSRRVNKTGRRRSVKAPPGERLHREVPHLAFVEADRYDLLIATLDARHAACARGRKAGAIDPRAGVSRKRTTWPGQHVTCGVCGRLYYWGGHGQAGRLMCAGVREHACWNAATFDGAEAARRLAGAVLALAEGLPDFDDAFRARAAAAAAERGSSRAARLRELREEIVRVEREVANLVEAVARMGLSEALRGRMAEAEALLLRLKAGLRAVQAEPDEAPELPPVAALKARAREDVGRMAFADPEFARLMRVLAPRIEVAPHRCLDGGAVVLRARLEVDLAPLLGPSGGVVGGLVARVASVDLFDEPQRVACRARVVALRAAGRTEREAAGELGLSVAAAQAAMALDRLMIRCGATDPYRRLAGPSEGGTKLRRHRHPRYRFRPLEGHGSGPS